MCQPLHLNSSLCHSSQTNAPHADPLLLLFVGVRRAFYSDGRHHQQRNDHSVHRTPSPSMEPANKVCTSQIHIMCCGVSVFKMHNAF